MFLLREVRSGLPEGISEEACCLGRLLRTCLDAVPLVLSASTLPPVTNLPLGSCRIRPARISTRMGAEGGFGAVPPSCAARMRSLRSAARMMRTSALEIRRGFPDGESVSATMKTFIQMPTGFGRLDSKEGGGH